MLARNVVTISGSRSLRPVRRLDDQDFCRPSCAFRSPSRRHVRFFFFPGAIEAAEQVKFRPCKSCKPEIQGTVKAGVLAISQVLRRMTAEMFEQRSEAKGRA